ncbi:polysaccharide biosynthesis protein [Ciceribacter sp. L1K23]|nr:polysaccharide biosynthesis protein [Ciceribacter sp. L1K23]
MAGRFPDLDRPTLFSEKVQVRKLYDRNPLYPVMVDKYGAKRLIAERAGERYVIPTLWIGRNLKDVEWSKIRLPAVVKPTHASGRGAFLRGPADIEHLLSDDPGEEWLSLKHHKINREWAYGEFEPKIIIEEMLVEGDEVPDDYRFFVFSGEVSHIEIRLRRKGVGFECNYTPDWQKMPYSAPYYEAFPDDLPEPAELAEMLEVVKKMAGESDFMRVDLYLTGGRIYVGELTLYPGGGFKGCVADEYDAMLGAKWKQTLTPARGSAET